MSQTPDRSAFEPMTDSFTPPSEFSETSASSVASDFATNSHPLLWQPDQPQFCKAIADYYGVSRKAVQMWYSKISTACPWLTEADLKLADGRYSLQCIQLMGNYRLSGQSIDIWKATQWEQHPEQVEAYLNAQTQQASALRPIAPQPEILEGELIDAEAILNNLSNRTSDTDQLIHQRRQHTQTLLDQNADQLQRLQQLLADRQRQQHQARRDKAAQWDAEITRETLDEFLFKQQRRDQLLTELNTLNSLGKSQSAEVASG